MSEQHRKEAEAQKRRADEAQAQNEPLKRRLHELQAFKESHEQEIQIVSILLQESCCFLLAHVILRSSLATGRTARFCHGTSTQVSQEALPCLPAYFVTELDMFAITVQRARAALPAPHCRPSA